MRTRDKRKLRRPGGEPQRWLVFGAAAVLVLAAAVLLMARLGPAAPAGAVVAAAKVKGDTAAAVTVEEWGDFQ